MKTYITQTIRRLILSVARNFILYKVKKSFTRLCTILFNKYPQLYRVVHYFFNASARFYSHLYSISLNLQVKFEKKYPLLYSILFYLYSEYLAILEGSPSRNTLSLIGLFVIIYAEWSNIAGFVILLLNSAFKEHLIKDVEFKKNHPFTFKILLSITSFINTVLVFYYFNIIFINVIKPFLLWIWDGILSMAGNGKRHINTGKLPSESRNKPPQKPSSSSFVHSDKKEEEEEYKNYKELLLTKFRNFGKANEEFNSADKDIGLDWEVSVRDLINDYSKYLSEADNKKLQTILDRKLPKFELSNDDTVHQFWLNKRASNAPGWHKTRDVLDIFISNSKKIQNELGGKSSAKSSFFRKETESFKNMWARPYKAKESIIKRELELSRSFDKLLKENNLSIKVLIDRVVKS